MPLPRSLSAALAVELGRSPLARSLLAGFLACRSCYRRPLAEQLVRVGRGSAGEAWEIRRLAALLLQCQALRIQDGARKNVSHLAALLGIGPPDFTATAPAELARELRFRLAPVERVLGPVEQPRPGRGAWADFLAYARKECKLALARYLFTPSEVAARILDQVRISQGEPRAFAPEHPHIGDNASRTVSALPPFEAEILAALREPARIYWVGESTPSEVNSLVEYPLGTVVLVIKPPGSCCEIEVKRAGRRGPRPLGCVFERDGEPVPVSHRLDGGSLGFSHHWDAYASSLIAEAWRRIHEEEAPLARLLSISAIRSLPSADGGIAIGEYFSCADRFGEGFAEMEKAMRRAVRAFRSENDLPVPVLSPGAGAVEEFLGRTAPSQVFLSPTSSFRVDKVERYLSAGGPEEYFAALGAEPAARDVRRLTDAVLDEALGLFVPPQGRHPDTASYVAAAFTVPANRRRADAAHRRARRDAGRFWGTVLALGGSSRGDSFVARNVGLKAAWERGEWTVRLHFMDHDGLLVGRYDTYPPDLLRAMVIDEMYLLETLDLLDRIYRVDAADRQEGRAVFEEELRNAFGKVREALVRGRFDDLIVGSSLDWARDWPLRVKRLARSRTRPVRLIAKELLELLARYALPV